MVPSGGRILVVVSQEQSGLAAWFCFIIFPRLLIFGLFWVCAQVERHGLEIVFIAELVHIELLCFI